MLLGSNGACLNRDSFTVGQRAPLLLLRATNQVLHTVPRKYHERSPELAVDEGEDQAGELLDKRKEQEHEYVGNQKRGSYDNTISFDDDNSADIKSEGGSDDDTTPQRRQRRQPTIGSTSVSFPSPRTPRKR